jgi:CubicO group peptidase (beta-lactamase class C family)
VTTSFRLPRSRRVAATAAIGALAAAAVAVPSASAGATTSLPRVTAKPAVLPSDAQIQAAIDQVDTRAQQLMALSHMPGMAVAVVWKGKIVFAKGYGVRKVGSPGLIDTNTVFQLASVSKSVGATVIAREVTKGTVAWTTPVKPNYRDLVLDDPWVTSHVTVADMYAHRSGLRDHAGDLLEELGYTQKQIASKYRYEKLLPTRTQFHYTNFGMAIAAQSVANKAGRSWWTLSQRDIYGPLGMTHTSSRFADYVNNPDRAWTHSLVNGKFVAKTVRNPDYEGAAASVSSSVTDMAKWLSMVLEEGKVNGKQLISPEALQPAVLPEIISRAATTPGGRSGFYGFGFNVDTTETLGVRLSHSGAFSAGVDTNYVGFPNLDLGIVALSNGYPQGYPEVLNAEFGDLVEHGKLTVDWLTIYTNAFKALTEPLGSLVGKKRPAKPVVARPLQNYLGAYKNPYYGPVSVTKRGSRLYLTIGANRTTYRLYLWNKDVWTFTPVGESATPGSISQATFSKPRAGKPQQLWLEYYSSNPDGTYNTLGTFRR